jgi:hypothetical protein
MCVIEIHTRQAKKPGADVIKFSEFVLLSSLSLILACSGGGETGRDIDFSSESVTRGWEDIGIVPRRAGSPPGLGQSRVSFAFISEIDGVSVFRHDLQGSVELFQLTGTGEPGTTGSQFAVVNLERVSIGRNEKVHIHANGSNHIHEDPAVSVYAALTKFPVGGAWGAKFTLSNETEAIKPFLLTFLVQDKNLISSYGSSIPESEQQVVSDLIPIEKLSSTTPPNPEMHNITIADALSLSQPIVISFITPAFCQSKLCGPVLEEAVNPNFLRYRDLVTFIHVEPYDISTLQSGAGFELVDVMTEWNLKTEPWVFVIGSDGTVIVGLEGITNEAELAHYIDMALNN